MNDNFTPAEIAEADQLAFEKDMDAGLGVCDNSPYPEDFQPY